MDGVKFGDLFFDAGHQAASFCSISVRLTGSDGEACIACFFRLNSAMASIASFNVSCGNSLTWERPYFSQNFDRREFGIVEQRQEAVAFIYRDEVRARFQPFHQLASGLLGN